MFCQSFIFKMLFFNNIDITFNHPKCYFTNKCMKFEFFKRFLFCDYFYIRI